MGNPLPARYPAGTGTGKKFYPWARGRVRNFTRCPCRGGHGYALLAPNQPHCHPYGEGAQAQGIARARESRAEETSRPAQRDGNQFPASPNRSQTRCCACNPFRNFFPSLLIYFFATSDFCSGGNQINC
jgi:hypothetical protein